MNHGLMATVLLIVRAVASQLEAQGKGPYDDRQEDHRLLLRTVIDNYWVGFKPEARAIKLRQYFDQVGGVAQERFLSDPDACAENHSCASVMCLKTALASAADDILRRPPEERSGFQATLLPPAAVYAQSA